MAAIEGARISTVQRVEAGTRRQRELKKRIAELEGTLDDTRAKLQVLEDFKARMLLEAKNRKERAEMEKKDAVLRFVAKLDQMTSGNKSAAVDVLPGIGSGAHVPRFLRTNAKIKNKGFSKAQTERITKEIWQLRTRLAEASKGSPPSLADATYHYLQAKLGGLQQVVEAGYSFLFGLWRFQFDADCELFLKILTGEVVECVHEEQKALQADIERLLRTLLRGRSGGVPKAEVVAALEVFFRVGQPGGKDVDNFAEVVEGLAADVPGPTVVDPEILFAEDENFNQGHFAEAVRDQYLFESVQYYQAVESSMVAEADDDGFVGQEGITRALCAAHHGVSEDMGQVLARILLKEKGQIHVTLCMHRLKEKGRRKLNAMLLKEEGTEIMRQLSQGGQAKFQEEAKRAQVVGAVKEVVAAIRRMAKEKNKRKEAEEGSPRDDGTRADASAGAAGAARAMPGATLLPGGPARGRAEAEECGEGAAELQHKMSGESLVDALFEESMDDLERDRTP